MGAWGTGPLENDTAADFVGSLAEAYAVAASHLEAALRKPAVEDDLDTRDEHVAAIAVVTALVQHKNGQPLTGELSALTWAAEVNASRLEQWQKRALLALDDLEREDEELMELWRESGEETAWRAELARLRQALS